MEEDLDTSKTAPGASRLSSNAVEPVLLDGGIVGNTYEDQDARYWDEHALPPIPMAVMQGDICRRDLLFELGLDAAVPS